LLWTLGPLFFFHALPVRIAGGAVSTKGESMMRTKTNHDATYRKTNEAIDEIIEQGLTVDEAQS